MDKQWKSCGRILLMVLLQVVWLHPLLANTTEDTSSSSKPVWQTTNALGDNYLSNRRALVGSGCMVNRLGADGVKVVPVITNLENLVDEDLTNVTKIGLVADVTVGGNPLVSVKDVKNYYAAGTQAGFVVTGSASGLLSLDVVKLFSIMFYCDGELVGTESVEKGQSAKGIGLSLIQISSDEACEEYVATAPKKFDEIRIAQVGAVNLTVAEVIGLKYAFVGTAKQYTITQSSMLQYATDMGRSKITTESNSSKYDSNDGLTVFHEGGHLDNDDLEDYSVIASVLSIAETFHAKINAKPTDGKEAFTAGTTVGVKYFSGSGLDLSLVKGAVIVCNNSQGKEVYRQALSGGVLGLNVVDTNYGSVAVTPDVDFSQVEFFFYMVVDLNIGATGVYYAYVQLQPDIEKHHCDLNPTASLNVCDCDNQYQLTASKDVAWTVKEQADESNHPVSISQNGLVTGLVTPGKYVFTATASAAYCTGSTLCSEDVTINYGASNDIKTTTESIIRLTGSDYTVTDGNSAGISLFGSLKNPNAITSTSLRDYAYTTAGASLTGKYHIVSVKKADDTSFSYTTKKYVGFVVLAKTTAINAKLLDFLTVDLYKNGEKVSGSLVKNNAVLSADLINTSGSAAQRTIYTVEVPAGTDFDEIALNNIGTLSVDLSQLNIYYAYVSDDSGNPENTGTLVSYKKTGASIDAANTEFVAVANVANTAFGLTELVDDSLTTGVTLPAVSVANGTKIGVKLGKTVNHEKQNLLVVTSNTSAVLSAKLVDVLKVELYKNGSKVADNATGSGVDVLNANVLGYTNTYSYINVSSTTSDFDEIVMTYGNGATVANDFMIYGILLRNDYNADGVPDDSDPEPCAQELVLDEDSCLSKSHDYANSRMIFHRNLNGDCWNPLILPVDLTQTQFKGAFGNDAVLSAAKEVKVESTTSDNTTTTTTTLMFEKVGDTDGVFLKKNTPYIIYVTKTELENHSEDARYESIEDGEVVGPMFIVDSGISYDKSDDYKTTHSATTSENETGKTFDFVGSYNASQEVGKGNYVFAKGNLYHLTKEAKTLKAYRCWIKYNGTSSSEAQLMGFTVNDGTTTDIHTVIEDAPNATNVLYDLMGKRVNSANLTPGIYILNGKKVIVK